MCKCRDLISELENVIAAQNRIIIEQAIEIEQLHVIPAGNFLSDRSLRYIMPAEVEETPKVAADPLPQK